MKEKKTKVCMIVQDKMVKGGIAAVISGYYGSKLEQDYDMIYVESYKDGGKLTKLWKVFVAISILQRCCSLAVLILYICILHSDLLFIAHFPLFIWLRGQRNR